MKKAVIQTGGKQYIVAKDDIIAIEIVGDSKTVDFDTLLVFDGADIKVGQPLISDVKVSGKVLDTVLADKVTSIRFKAKKRVNKKHGHRQSYSRVQITKIA